MTDNLTAVTASYLWAGLVIGLAVGIVVGLAVGWRLRWRWLSIATAPRDGTEVLVWREDCGQFIASYTSADSFPLLQSEIDELSEEALTAKDWFMQWPYARRLEGSEVPTHWASLPPPPEKH